jgi:CDP-6-deoxy-D-xylo-4-hexulose-3-dehydrase
MICTNDDEVYQQLRMLRSHGMVRESNDAEYRKNYIENNPELNPDFIFAYPAYNVRNTELGGILGRNQLKRLDANINQRNINLNRFLSQIDPSIYRTDFKLDGCSNYAFNLILKRPDDHFVKKLMTHMHSNGIEFRRGSAGGGNQMRQPYLKGVVEDKLWLDFPGVEHVHFYGFYIGNFPDLRAEEIDSICAILNSVE